MPRTKKRTLTARVTKVTRSEDQPSYFEQLQKELNLNQSYLSLILGLFIVLVGGVLVFNYFRGSKGNLIPAQQTSNQEGEQKDVESDSLPGKYTVKEGDTLFTIAEKYYEDGFKYSKIVQVNNLSDANTLAIGQVLTIPKDDEAKASESSAPTPSPANGEVKNALSDNGTGGAVNQTAWGEKITGDSYTIVEGDWLSKIAGRAYGDIYAYDKIAKANNIPNPDLIEPGVVLKIPR